MNQVFYRRTFSILKTVLLASAMLSIPLLHLRADAQATFADTCIFNTISPYNITTPGDGVALEAFCQTNAGDYFPTVIELYGVNVDVNGFLFQEVPSDRDSTFLVNCTLNDYYRGTITATCYNQDRSATQRSSLTITNIYNNNGTLTYLNDSIFSPD
jgi:hypothetical protein